MELISQLDVFFVQHFIFGTFLVIFFIENVFVQNFMVTTRTI